MKKTTKIKKLFKRFKPEHIRAYLTVPRNWLHIAGLAIFLLSLYALAFNQLPQVNKIEISNNESGGLPSITITGSEFKIELKDIYSDIDESVFNDQAKANQYIEAISYKAKKKNINTVNNKKVAINNINTNIVYVDDSNIEFNKADIELKKQDNDKYINTILYCEDNNFNKKIGQCGNWQISNIKPENKEDYISFTAYHFSAYVGAYLEIIDVQSNLTKGDVWEVRFQTEGQDTLEIEAVNGTLFGIDIEFINLTCGENQIPNENIVWEGQKLIVENYTCDNEISRIRNQTITGGRHWLSFSFGYTQNALAHNFACDSGDLDTDCYVTSQQYLGDGDTISGTGNLIVQSGGDLTASSSATSGTTYGDSFGIDMGGDITIQSGGMITGNVTATATDIDVQSGGAINVNSKGFQYSEGPGAGIDSGYAGGAGYGGDGGDGAWSAGGSVYGSTTEPSYLGSGGGSDAGGAGGGVVKLTVSGTTTITGTIYANGGNASANSGGGSGGSVWIDTGTLEGSGTTTANGGTAGDIPDGGGGGGRIAVYYTTDNSSITYQAYGDGPSGRYGGAGTIYKKSSTQSYGDLIIDNNDQDYEDGSYIGKTILDDQNFTFDTLTIQNDGHLDISSTTNITYSTFNWSDAGNITDNGGTLSPFSDGGSLTIATTSSVFEKTSRSFTNLTVNGNMHTEPLTVSGDLYLSGNMTLKNHSTSTDKLDVTGNITIVSGATLTHYANTTVQTHVINLEATNLTIESGGAINVNSKGFQYSEGPGAGIDSGYAGGAGYGGDGGDGAWSAGGSVYGSTTEPSYLGSGGGSDAGGAGGGVVKLTVSGTTTITGTIYANGGNASANSGGGSGGSVWIDTGTLEGSGTTTANGGTAGDIPDGGGGGGRIAVYYTTDNSSITYQAYGDGPSGRYGGAGTIYKKSSTQSYGDLIIDNNDQDYEDGSYIGKTPIDFSINLNTLTVQNYGLLVAEAGSSITYNTISWDNQAIIEDHGGTFTMFDGNQDVIIAATSRLYTKTARNCNSLTVNGKLSHMKNSSAETYKIDITAVNDITINSGATISLTGRGYTGGYGPGAGTDEGSYGSGAGHGGHGGATLDASSSGGPTYDSTTTPINIGSGGGDDGGVTGGPSGGGAIKLTAGGTTTINANISANGNSASNTNGGGASGGSIYIICDTLAGSALLSADGGNPQTANAGGGGGGRIALDYNTYNATLTFSVDGGGTTYPGADGTIYPDANPAISTQDATSIQMTSATGNGSVDSLGFNSITEHGHIWGLDSSPAFMNPPISQWKMNDNAANTTVIDSVGSNNGTAQQNTSAISSSTGKINSALEFNGSSDYIEIGKKASDLGVGGSNPRSVSAWVYTRSFNNGGIFEFGEESALKDFSLRTAGTINQWRLQLWSSDVDFGYTSQNKWVHFVVSYDGSQVIIYADGLVAAQSSKALNTSDVKTVKIGIWRTDEFDGFIDDVRIYDYALTTDEISQIYNSGNGTEATIFLYSALGAKSSTGAFESPLTGLTLDTTYYICSYATMSDGSTIYGNEVQFDTLAEPIHKYRFNPGGYYNFKGYFKFK